LRKPGGNKSESWLDSDWSEPGLEVVVVSKICTVVLIQGEQPRFAG